MSNVQNICIPEIYEKEAVRIIERITDQYINGSTEIVLQREEARELYYLLQLYLSNKKDLKKNREIIENIRKCIQDDEQLHLI